MYIIVCICKGGEERKERVVVDECVVYLLIVTKKFVKHLLHLYHSESDHKLTTIKGNNLLFALKKKSQTSEFEIFSYLRQILICCTEAHVSWDSYSYEQSKFDEECLMRKLFA